MDSAQDVPRDHSKGVRVPPLRTFSNMQAYQRPHPPAPAVRFPDEQPYGGISCEGPYELRDSYIPVVPDAKAVNMKRRTSRFGLAGLFGRSRAPDHEGKQGRLGIPLEADENPERLQIGEDETSQGTGRIYVSEKLDALPPMESPATHVRHRTSKPNLKAKSSFKKDISTKTWDPPPLFQAYPQAVKHATLRAPSLSAESIIRLHTNRNLGIKPGSDSYTPDPYPSRGPKEKRLKRNNAADSLSKGDWARKIFVLVTAGYFLQYAGDGSSDRFPEKIMPLTKESAAFASDVIPGQPYVLQVSQVTDDLGTLDKDASRSMLKKLGLRNEMRRSTSTFLLVLESPEEMNTWLVAVRREIQAISGKEYKSDEFRKHTIEDPVLQLQQKPSQRYLVKRDPNRFSEKPPDPASHYDRTNMPRLAEIPRKHDETSTLIGMKRQSLATQGSTESRSISNATASINQIYLDRLRESPRQSYASTAAKTTSTSRGSSPKFSPHKITSEVLDSSSEFTESRQTPSTYPGLGHGLMYKAPSANASHRTSMHTSSLQEAPFCTPQHRRTSSPTAPNFSIPTFTKRYSTSPALTSTISKTRTPPTTLHHDPPSPSVVVEEGSVAEKRTSTIGELQHLRKPSPEGARGISSAENDTCATPPHSSGSCNPPSSESEKRFSRRLSSLEYSRGVSPLQLARQSPSPHPPPTAALPALPRVASPYRSSLIRPPITALPPIPSVSKLPARHSMLPPPTTSGPTVPVSESSYLADPSPPVKCLPASPAPEQSWHPSLAAPTVSTVQPVSGNRATTRPSLTQRPVQGAAKVNCMEHGKPPGPVNMEGWSDTGADQPPPRSPQTGLKTAFDFKGLTPLLDDCPPKPIREPLLPQPQQGYTQGPRRISPIGREPPPVYSPVTSPRPRIPVSPRTDSYVDGAGPHPFIPPIRVSERKFRGSLDGPWNPAYGAPQRTFLDLSVN